VVTQRLLLLLLLPLLLWRVYLSGRLALQTAKHVSRHVHTSALSGHQLPQARMQQPLRSQAPVAIQVLHLHARWCRMAT
jgi:hypothetical protein